MKTLSKSICCIIFLFLFFSTAHADEFYGFLKSGDTYTSLNNPGAIYTLAFGINDAGNVVGYYCESSYSNCNGFLKTGDTYTSLDLPGSFGTAYDINDAGTIVGSYSDSGIGYGFLKTGDTYTSFDYPGEHNTYAYDINDAGMVVGGSGSGANTFGFLMSGDTYNKIIYPGTNIRYTTARGINDAGAVVGSYFDVAEPTTMLLLGLGLMGLAGVRRRLS